MQHWLFLLGILVHILKVTNYEQVKTKSSYAINYNFYFC